MQREEKQLEATLHAILNRVNDLKSAIQALITKLETEYETINWPTFLDNYAILSGHVSFYFFIPIKLCSFEYYSGSIHLPSPGVNEKHTYLIV